MKKRYILSFLAAATALVLLICTLSVSAGEIPEEDIAGETGQIAEEDAFTETSEPAAEDIQAPEAEPAALPVQEPAGALEPAAEAEEAEVFLTDYTLTIRNAADITAVRIAPGNWTTSNDIRNAPGLITLSATVIRQNTDASGNLKYELNDGGVYSVWYKYSDGTQKIASAVTTEIVPYVENDGITVTVHNLYGVSDFFISRGTLTTYSQVKANTVVNVTSKKIAGAKSYTYIVPEEGEHTVWVRYTDTNRQPTALYVNCTVVHPTVSTDGRQINIGNLEGVKVVRIAQGTYSTVSQIKTGTNSRSFSSSELLSKLDGNGRYGIINTVGDSGTTFTFVVQYRNGYSEFHTVTLYKKAPTYTVSNATVTFTGLDGLSLFRYAPGTHTTSTAIKEAAGSQFIRPENVTGGKITLTLEGTYSFLVQYYEGSYKIITLTLNATQYVNPGSAVMTINGVNVSNYRIVIPSSCTSKVSEAGTKLRDFIRTATGQNLSIVRDSTSATTYEICIGKTNRENGQISRSGMNELEFTVAVKGSKLFFAGAVDSDKRLATYYSVFFFAEKELGFHFYQDDCIVCRPTARITLGSNYKYNFKPGFESRSIYMEGAWEDCFLNDDYYSGVNWVHELNDWINGTSGAYNAATPCLTNETNIQKVINKTKSLLASHPNSNAVWVSMNDSEDYCNCSACAAVYRAEGSRAGTIVRLCNRVSSAIKSQYPNVVIFTLAYNYAIAPPTQTKPASNVIPYYCSISSCPSHAYNDTSCQQNADIRNNIQGWARISSKLYVWDYACNFAYSMAPLPDFYSLRDSMNFFYQNKVKGLFINAVDKKTGDFNELRGYLITQLMYKPAMTSEEYFGLMDSFIKDYYGDTNLYLRQYLDILESLSNSKDFKFSTEPKRMYVYNDVVSHIDEIEALWAAAFAEVRGNSTYTRRMDISYQSWCFLKQCASFRTNYVLGNAAKKAQYSADNEKLYNNIVKYNLSFRETGSFTYSATSSPENW